MAKKQETSTSSTSRRSYEANPPLKDISCDLNGKSGNLRKQDKKTLSFEKTYPTDEELDFFSKEVDKIVDNDSDFKDTLNVIADTFSTALTDTSQKSKIHRIVIETFFQSARALAVSIEARDPYTGGHSDRVFQMSREIGKRCGLSPKEQLFLEGGSLLHDVGKLGIRDAVLLKPGPLTDAEYKEMQLHPIIGGQIINKIEPLKGCGDPVLYHHERIDGYGYPYGLKADEIPLIARITSITDAYDAMTTNRVYRKALSHEQAIQEVLRNSGTQFDPEVVKVFVEWWEETFQTFPESGQALYGETVMPAFGN